MCLNVKLVKHVGAVCNWESESECSLASPVSTLKALGCLPVSGWSGPISFSRTRILTRTRFRLIEHDNKSGPICSRVRYISDRIPKLIGLCIQPKISQTFDYGGNVVWIVPGVQIKDLSIWASLHVNSKHSCFGKAGVKHVHEGRCLFISCMVFY